MIDIGFQIFISLLKIFGFKYSLIDRLSIFFRCLRVIHDPCSLSPNILFLLISDDFAVHGHFWSKTNDIHCNMHLFMYFLSGGNIWFSVYRFLGRIILCTLNFSLIDRLSIFFDVWELFTTPVVCHRTYYSSSFLTISQFMGTFDRRLMIFIVTCIYSCIFYLEGTSGSQFIDF